MKNLEIFAEQVKGCFAHDPGTPPKVYGDWLQKCKAKRIKNKVRRKRLMAGRR